MINSIRRLVRWHKTKQVESRFASNNNAYRWARFFADQEEELLTQIEMLKHEGKTGPYDLFALFRLCYDKMRLDDKIEEDKKRKKERAKKEDERFKKQPNII